eukprot:XP_001693201.1 predicted protein [Chlamydomonas reinhardtii]
MGQPIHVAIWLLLLLGGFFEAARGSARPCISLSAWEPLRSLHDACSTETTSNPDGPTLVSQRRAVREPLLAITLQCLAADTSALAEIQFAADDVVPGTPAARWLAERAARFAGVTTAGVQLRLASGRADGGGGSAIAQPSPPLPVATAATPVPRAGLQPAVAPVAPYGLRVDVAAELGALAEAGTLLPLGPLLARDSLLGWSGVSSSLSGAAEYNGQAASHASSPANSLRGRLAAAPLPGTTRVLLRSVGGGAAGGSNTTVQLLAAGSSAGLQLVNCTSLLCPLATETTRDEHGFTRPVNRATYLAPTILMVAATADSRSSTSDRDVAALLSYYLASDVAGAALDTAAVLDPDLGMVPARLDQTAPELWAAAGYDHGDAAAVLPAYRSALASPNPAYPLRMRGQAAFGAVLAELLAGLRPKEAPGPGPDTTLLLSDIADSTTLWEVLSADVMDRSVRLHSMAVRHLLLRHRGFESATEGDAFIAAFANPMTALNFCVDLQVTLLALDWPNELLERPEAAPAYAVTAVALNQRRRGSVDPFAARQPRRYTGGGSYEGGAAVSMWNGSTDSRPQPPSPFYGPPNFGVAYSEGGSRRGGSKHGADPSADRSSRTRGPGAGSSSGELPAVARQLAATVKQHPVTVSPTANRDTPYMASPGGNSNASSAPGGLTAVALPSAPGPGPWPGLEQSLVRSATATAAVISSLGVGGAFGSSFSAGAVPGSCSGAVTAAVLRLLSDEPAGPPQPQPQQPGAWTSPLESELPVPSRRAAIPPPSAAESARREASAAEAEYTNFVPVPLAELPLPSSILGDPTLLLTGSGQLNLRPQQLQHRGHSISGGPMAGQAGGASSSGRHQHTDLVRRLYGKVSNAAATAAAVVTGAATSTAGSNSGAGGGARAGGGYGGCGEDRQPSYHDQAGALLIHRGLRLRLGFHAGLLSAAEVNSNAATGRAAYSGVFMAVAREEAQQAMRATDTAPTDAAVVEQTPVQAMALPLSAATGDAAQPRGRHTTGGQPGGAGVGRRAGGGGGARAGHGAHPASGNGAGVGSGGATTAATIAGLAASVSLAGRAASCASSPPGSPRPSGFTLHASGMSMCDTGPRSAAAAHGNSQALLEIEPYTSGGGGGGASAAFAAGSHSPVAPAPTSSRAGGGGLLAGARARLGLSSPRAPRGLLTPGVSIALPEDAALSDALASSFLASGLATAKAVLAAPPPPQPSAGSMRSPRLWGPHVLHSPGGRIPHKVSAGSSGAVSGGGAATATAHNRTSMDLTPNARGNSTSTGFGVQLRRASAAGAAGGCCIPEDCTRLRSCSRRRRRLRRLGRCYSLNCNGRGSRPPSSALRTSARFYRSSTTGLVGGGSSRGVVGGVGGGGSPGSVTFGTYRTAGSKMHSDGHSSAAGADAVGAIARSATATTNSGGGGGGRVLVTSVRQAAARAPAVSLSPPRAGASRGADAASAAASSLLQQRTRPKSSTAVPHAASAVVSAARPPLRHSRTGLPTEMPCADVVDEEEELRGAAPGTAPVGSTAILAAVGGSIRVSECGGVAAMAAATTTATHAASRGAGGVTIARGGLLSAAVRAASGALARFHRVSTPVEGTMVRSTGRIAYRGRAQQRAARMAGLARAGQMLVQAQAQQLLCSQRAKAPQSTRTAGGSGPNSTSSSSAPAAVQPLHSMLAVGGGIAARGTASGGPPTGVTCTAPTLSLVLPGLSTSMPAVAEALEDSTSPSTQAGAETPTAASATAASAAAADVIAPPACAGGALENKASAGATVSPPALESESGQAGSAAGAAAAGWMLRRSLDDSPARQQRADWQAGEPDIAMGLGVQGICSGEAGAPSSAHGGTDGGAPDGAAPPHPSLGICSAAARRQILRLLLWDPCSDKPPSEVAASSNSANAGEQTGRGAGADLLSPWRVPQEAAAEEAEARAEEVLISRFLADVYPPVKERWRWVLHAAARGHKDSLQVAGRALAGALLLQATGRPIRQADPVLCAATVIVMTLLQAAGQDFPTPTRVYTALATIPLPPPPQCLWAELRPSMLQQALPTDTLVSPLSNTHLLDTAFRLSRQPEVFTAWQPAIFALRTSESVETLVGRHSQLLGMYELMQWLSILAPETEGANPCNPLVAARAVSRANGCLMFYPYLSEVVGALALCAPGPDDDGAGAGVGTVGGGGAQASSSGADGPSSDAQAAADGASCPVAMQGPGGCGNAACTYCQALLRPNAIDIRRVALPPGARARLPALAARLPVAARVVPDSGSEQSVDSAVRAFGLGAGAQAAGSAAATVSAVARLQAVGAVGCQRLLMEIVPEVRKRMAAHGRDVGLVPVAVLDYGTWGAEAEAGGGGRDCKAGRAAIEYGDCAARSAAADVANSKKKPAGGSDGEPRPLLDLDGDYGRALQALLPLAPLHASERVMKQPLKQAFEDALSALQRLHYRLRAEADAEAAEALVCKAEGEEQGLGAGAGVSLLPSSGRLDAGLRTGIYPEAGRDSNRCTGTHAAAGPDDAPCTSGRGDGTGAAAWSSRASSRGSQRLGRAKRLPWAHLAAREQAAAARLAEAAEARAQLLTYLPDVERDVALDFEIYSDGSFFSADGAGSSRLSCAPAGADLYEPSLYGDDYNLYAGRQEAWLRRYDSGRGRLRGLDVNDDEGFQEFNSCDGDVLDLERGGQTAGGSERGGSEGDVFSSDTESLYEWLTHISDALLEAEEELSSGRWAKEAGDQAVIAGGETEQEQKRLLLRAKQQRREAAELFKSSMRTRLQLTRSCNAKTAAYEMLLEGPRGEQIGIDADITDFRLAVQRLEVICELLQRKTGKGSGGSGGSSETVARFEELCAVLMAAVTDEDGPERLRWRVLMDAATRATGAAKHTAIVIIAGCLIADGSPLHELGPLDPVTAAAAAACYEYASLSASEAGVAEQVYYSAEQFYAMLHMGPLPPIALQHLNSTAMRSMFHTLSTYGWLGYLHLVGRDGDNNAVSEEELIAAEDELFGCELVDYVLWQQQSQQSQLISTGDADTVSGSGDEGECAASPQPQQGLPRSAAQAVALLAATREVLALMEQPMRVLPAEVGATTAGKGPGWSLGPPPEAPAGAAGDGESEVRCRLRLEGPELVAALAMLLADGQALADYRKGSGAGQLQTLWLPVGNPPASASAVSGATSTGAQRAGQQHGPQQQQLQHGIEVEFVRCLGFSARETLGGGSTTLMEERKLRLSNNIVQVTDKLKPADAAKQAHKVLKEYGACYMHGKGAGGVLRVLQALARVRQDMRQAGGGGRDVAALVTETVHYGDADVLNECRKATTPAPAAAGQHAGTGASQQQQKQKHQPAYAGQEGEAAEPLDDWSLQAPGHPTEFYLAPGVAAAAQKKLKEEKMTKDVAVIDRLAVRKVWLHTWQGYDGISTNASSHKASAGNNAVLSKSKTECMERAWRCTQPDAHAAAINESEGSEPSSQLLQAVATTGKRLPWAHLAAREEAAAAQQTAEGAGTAAESQNGVEGEQATALPTAKTASSAADSWAQALGGAEPPAQDWSWLASPPWGVVPLPPELACRVAGSLRQPPPSERPAGPLTPAEEQLWQDLEQLKARIDVQASRRVRVGQVADFYARSPPPPGVAGEESDKDVRFAPLRCYGSERQVAQGYMTLLMQDLSAKTRAGSPDPESDTGGGGGWRRLAKLVVPWAEERRKRIWRWLLETAAGLEEAEAAGGAGKARTAAEGSSSVALQWGAAAEEVLKAAIGTLVLLYLVVQDFLQIQQQAATKFGFCAAEQLNIFDPLVLASALPAYLLARPVAAALAAAVRGLCLLRIPPTLSAPAPPLLSAKDAERAKAGLAAVIPGPDGGCDVLRLRLPCDDAAYTTAAVLCLDMSSISSEPAIGSSGASLIFQPIPALEAMASHLRRFLVQLRAGLCAAHVRGVEAIGRLMSALAKVRAEMRDGPRGASRDCAAWVASILDPGDEPQTASELKAQPGGEAGGEARAQGAEPSDTVDNEDDSEEDADADGAETEGAAKQRRSRAPRGSLPQPGLLRYGDLLSQYGDADAESVAWLELQLAAMVHVLQRREEEPAATQHQEDEGSGSGAHAGHSSRRQQPEQQPPHEQPGKAPARKKQPRLDVKLDVFFFEVVPGKPWELVPPTSAVVRNLNRAMEKEQLAQLAYLADADVSAEQHVTAELARPDGCGENYDSGTLTYAAAPLCPSRDRARASLRRLRPTAWRCTQPDAHAAASNESEGSEPSSQLLQAVATAGKRLPWAHLAAREEAAAGMGVSTSGRGADGDQTDAETRRGKQQQSAAQDWSWLASPPWGVVPLPPELACRVGPHGRLRPGACGAAEAIATHAESVASACPPHAHLDPRCAQLHTQLHRMAAAVQQVLAVAALATTGGTASAAEGGAAAAPDSVAKLHALTPVWVGNMLVFGGQAAAISELAARISTLATTAAEALSDGPGCQRPTRDPAVLLGATSAQQTALQLVDVAFGRSVIDHRERWEACNRLQPVLECGLLEPHLLSSSGPTSGREQQQQQSRGQHVVMAAWRGERQQVQELLVFLTKGQPQRELGAGGQSPWRGLWKRMEGWAADRRSQQWAWLLQMAAAGEEAEAAVGVGAAGAAGQEDAQVVRAWGEAASEVLRGATCWLGLYAVLRAGLHAEASAAGHYKALNFDAKRFQALACELDPFVMAPAFPMFLLARVMDGYLREPHATIAMFRALWHRDNQHVSTAVGELIRSWQDAWAAADTAAQEEELKLQRGRALAHELEAIHEAAADAAAVGDGGDGLDAVLAGLAGGWGEFYISDEEVAAAHDDLALYARSAGVVEALAAVHELANAGVAAAPLPPPLVAAALMAAAGGGCDLVRLRVPPPGDEDVNAAALLLGMSMHTLAYAPATAAAGTHLLFQPAFSVAQWTDKTTVPEMVLFLRLNLLERHLGICAAGVQGVAALARVLTAVAKLREELCRPSGAKAAAAPPARDFAVQINRSQTVTMVELVPEAAGVEYDPSTLQDPAVSRQAAQLLATLANGALADVELAAAAVLCRLRQAEGAEEQQEEQESAGQRRRKAQQRRLPRHCLKLDVWIHEVAPGRPWELVLPPAERVADWNKKMGKLVLAAKR